MCLATLMGCQREGTHEEGCLLPDTLEVREGDVVLRRCAGLTSRLVVESDTGGVFSHVGIVVDSAGQPMVVHAVPGEPDYKGDPDRVKMTPIGDFYARGYAQAAAVMRPLDHEAGRRAARKALEVYRRGTRFDHDFDDRDTSAMYCTELVVHAYRAAGVELVGPERTGLKLPLVERRCILPSQVERSDELKRIYMFNP